MERLSLDLLYCVCGNFKGKRSTLRAVRLVNKTLAAAATRFLFHTLLVYQTPKSWEKLSLIARCPWLAKYVVKLEVAALKYLPHFSDFRRWKRFTWPVRWNDAYDQNNRVAMVALLLERKETHRPRILSLDRHMRFEDWRQHPEVSERNEQLEMGIAAHLSSEHRGNTKSLLEFQPTNLDVAFELVHGYERYRYWHDGENELSDLLYPSQDPQPSLDLVPLPNLQTVAVLGSHNLYGYNSTWASVETDRNFRESRLRQCWARYEAVPNGVHTSLALRTLDASEVYITRLELNRYSEVLRDVQFSVPPLKKLQKLVLHLLQNPSLVDFSELCSYSGRWELPVWLQSADDLQTITISIQASKEEYNSGAYWYFDVIALLHGAEWPKLQCVDFNEAFVRPKSLLRFLSEHTRSLQSIHVEKPKISKVAWQSLASEFQALEFNSPHVILHIDIPDQYDDSYSTKHLENDEFWIDRTNRPYLHR